MAKVLIEYEGNIDGLSASLKEIKAANEDVSDSAKRTAKEVSDEYKKVGQASKDAFAGSEVKKSLQDQEKNIDSLKGSLVELFQEEVKLLSQNKKLSEEYKNNRAAAEATRKEFDKLQGTTKKLNADIPKTAQEVGKLEDRLRELSLAGKQNEQEFDDIARAIGEYKSAITTADRAIDLYAKSTDAATGRLGELEDKLYDLAIAGKTGTDEFKNTVQEVATLKRAVFEVDQQVDSYVERSRGLTAVVQNVELVANAFQITQGVAALFGDENEELQKTLVKLNGILAITQGLEQARTILLEQSAKKTGIYAAAQKALSFATEGSVKALKSFRAILIATGAGAIIAAIALIVSYWDDIKELIGGASSESNNFLKNQVKITEEAKDQLSLLERRN